MYLLVLLERNAEKRKKKKNLIKMVTPEQREGPGGGESGGMSLLHVLPYSFEFWSHITNLVVVQWLGHVRLFATPWTAACQVPLSSTVSRSLLRFISIESVMLNGNTAPKKIMISSDKDSI